MAGKTTQMAVALFRQKAPQVMAQLIADFAVTPTEAAAILGNIGHECLGFTELQERAPSVPGSRGGYGWCQWTGARRKAYEAYCQRTGKDASSDAANYAWLFVELKGSEAASLEQLKSAVSLEDATGIFCRAFLRPGIAHMESRVVWAKIALEAWTAARPEAPVPLPRREREAVVQSAIDSDEKHKAVRGTVLAGTGAVISAGTLTEAVTAPAAGSGADWVLLAVAGGAMLATIAVAIWVALHHKRIRRRLRDATEDSQGGRQ